MRTLDSRAAWIKGDMARYVADRWGTAGGVGVLAEKLGENVNTLRLTAASRKRGRKMLDV